MLQKIAETLGKGCNPQKEKNAAPTFGCPGNLIGHGIADEQQRNGCQQG